MIWVHTFGYKLLLLLHIASVIVGFGPWMLNGLLGRAAGRSSPDGSQAIAGAALDVGKASQFAMYGVFIFGGALVGASQKAVKFSQWWVPAAIVLWIVAVGLLHGVVLPAQRKLRDGTGERGDLVKRLSMGVGIMNLVVLVTLVLMIWEPGVKHF